MKSKISVPSALSSFDETWSPRLIASLDSAYDIKVVKLDGAFVWHSHPDADEFFYLLKGALTLELEVPTERVNETETGSQNSVSAGAQREDVVLQPGEVFVVPKGMRHRPVAERAEIMLIEKNTVVNTGDAPVSERTRKPRDVRVETAESEA